MAADLAVFRFAFDAEVVVPTADAAVVALHLLSKVLAWHHLPFRLQCVIKVTVLACMHAGRGRGLTYEAGLDFGMPLAVGGQTAVGLRVELLYAESQSMDKGEWGSDSLPQPMLGSGVTPGHVTLSHVVPFSHGTHICRQTGVT